MDEVEAGGRTDLRHYLQVVRRRKAVIALAVVAGVAIALAYSFIKSPTYSATATVLVPQQLASADLNVTNSQLQPSDALQRYLADQQQFAQGDAVKTQAQKALGTRAHISVGTSTTSDVLTFTGVSGSQTEAAKIANAYANAYLAASRASQVNQYTQQVTALQTSIANLQAKAAALPPNDPQLPAIEQSINTLTQSVEQTQAASQLSSQVGPSVVTSARIPTSPASPKPVEDGLLGLLVGLCGGLGLAFLVERLDDRINSRSAAERAAGGLPLIALLPAVESWKAKESHHVALIEDPTSNVAEAYRTFRTGVQFLSIDDPKRVIGITSSIPNEGKTTSVANLAVSFARAGQRVIIVSCDLRRPRIHDFFGLSNDVGLTSVLLGSASLYDAVVQIPNEPSLRVLPSGPVPPNPAEILSMDRVRLIVNDLAEVADLVLLDCPPALPVTDALLLSRLTDGILILASTESTSKQQLQRTVELFRQVQAPLLGLVLNRVPVDSEYAYGYGYEYGYGPTDETSGMREGLPDAPVAKSPIAQPTTRSRGADLDDTGSGSVGAHDDYDATPVPSMPRPWLGTQDATPTPHETNLGGVIGYRPGREATDPPHTHQS